VAQAAQLGAILTAMVTPFDRDGELSEDAARRLARHLVDHGSDGLVVAGTTGESPTLSDEEKLRLLDVVLEEVGDDATVILGSGSNDTAHSVHLTAEGTRHGAHAMLVVTPYYNKPSRRGLVAHFRAVAGSTDRPVMLYNIPSRCVINLEPDLLAELAETENIVAVKQANADMDQAKQIVEDGRLALYAGDDNLVCKFAEIGGAGGVCVTSHFLGDQVKDMYEAACRGDVVRAREIDAELQDAYETLFMTVGTTMTKAALNLLDFDVGGLRLPLVEASEEEREAARKFLARHGLLAAAAR
jgi:4-hydroxy-tetrahydrodipicolinate synthase